MDFHIETDLTMLCRVCMTETTGIQSVNIYAVSDLNSPNIYNMLKAVCATVFSSGDIQEQEAKESLGMPKVVCLDCKRRVLAAYDLHETCVENDRRLWEMIMVKQELQEDEQIEISNSLQVSDDKFNKDGMSAHVNVKPQELNQNDSSVELLKKSDGKPSLLDAKLSGSTVDSQDTSKAAESDDETPAIGSTPHDPALKTCDLCLLVCRSVIARKEHMKLTHPEQIISCGECDAVFFSQLKLDDHIMFHRTGRKHACPVCKKRYRTTTGLRYHTRKHSSNIVRYNCTHCDKSFDSKDSLTQHELRHTRPRLKRFRCEQCPARFFTKGVLNSHMVVHTGEKRFPCDICGARLSTSNSLAKHIIRIHTDERPHACSICEMRFVTRTHLTRHTRTHTGEKPYQCAYCDRAFAQSNDLMKHSKCHVGDKPWQCDRCDTSFRLMTELRNHYKVHFQPVEDDAAKNATISEDDMMRFTAVSVLNKRFEQEKLRDQQRKDTEKQ